ncbi:MULTISPECIES: YncE family protein [Dyella]|uniref:YncE family protein n=2 Tax=Dyella TaxID=231454 RepID=A0A4R0YIS6_9GAMM|nr:MULTISPECIES: YncE family protein [Dyella]TBR36558.1 YncE family protein [Dyella terrae]TCI08350.1 YncE family protein [Dyella soli]
MYVIPLRALAVALALLPCPAGLLAADAPPVQVIKRIPLGGTGGWDYLAVDPAHHHLFVSHGDRVIVVDTSDDHVVADIPDTQGVHGIAVAPELGQGFTSNGAANAVTVFDLASLKTLATIPGTGANPDAILFDPMSHDVFTFNGKAHSASVIDPEKRSVVATIDLPGKPEFAQADGAGHIFVNIEDRAEMVQIDALQRKVTRTWSLKPCESPSGLAMDKAHHRLFSVCDNETMVVSDATKGRVVAKLPIGQGPDAVSFDDDTGTIYTSNGHSGNLTVIHQDGVNRYHVVATVPTQVGARTQALDASAHRLYLSVGERSVAAAGKPATTEAGTFQVLVLGY